MKLALYKLIPRNLVTQGMYRLARITRPSWLKNIIIKIYILITGADTSFAIEKNPYHYKSLNDFFTRALADNVRPINPDSSQLTSPVDGRCAEFGAIEANKLVQAKNILYTLEQLLDDPALAQQFYHGQTATLYLAPDDYHRIHMPCDGQLRNMRFCPGEKHSVSLSLLDKIPNIFAENERAVCVFETNFGLMAMVLVGALNVSSIETVWHGELHDNGDNYYDYSKEQHFFKKGTEIGRFNLGSTVILIFANPKISWQSQKLQSSDKILMGQPIATLNSQI